MDEKTKLFLCEDDENLGILLKEFLEAKGYETHLFRDGEEGLLKFGQEPYDLCILDVMMPIKDGFSLAKDIRALNQRVPIIFLTAKTMKEDVLRGFEMGADDYITKPFSLDELLARIDAVLRRVRGVESKAKRPYYQIGKFFFDTQKQILTTPEKNIIKLTTKESQLLTALCMFANDTLERNYALKTIWGNDNYFNARSMDVYITKLRKMLKDDPSIEIKNVHGKGYRLNISFGDEIPQDLVTVL